MLCPWCGARKVLCSQYYNTVIFVILFFSIGNIAVNKRRLIIILGYIPWIGSNGCLISVRALLTMCFKYPISFHHDIPVSSFDWNLSTDPQQRVLVSDSSKEQLYTHIGWAGIAQAVYGRAAGWTVRGHKPGVCEIFHTRPDRPWGPPSLLYNRYRVFPWGVRRPERGVDHPHHLAPRLKKEYSHTSTLLLDLREMFKSEIYTYVHTCQVIHIIYYV